MSRRPFDTRPDPDTEWLDHVRPTGLVVAAAILKELGVTPVRQTALDSEAVKALLAEGSDAPGLRDPWAFVREIFGWRAELVCGAPGGPALPQALSVSLPGHDTVLAPEWAVRAAGGADGIQLLVQLLPAGLDPDRRGALEGWEASAHQRFERLLRETQVFTGVLVSDRELRLMHAPAAETSGWLSFPLRELGTVAGRPMLAGLKLLLNAAALFTNPENKRLPALLKRSREAQASVSQELASQVLGALHELLRGLHAAERAAIERLARERAHHLYEGLLTVLMRLVFILYAEDRDLLPSHTDADARGLYETNYAVRGLFARLSDDDAQNPDTMDERVGGWGQLLALFRLIHRGDRAGWIVARGGKLFDPDAFPFIEGRSTATEPPRVVRVSDGCLLRVLRGLMTLRGERLSYRTLDVEQIGSVYETVMGFSVEIAAGPSLAIKAGKNNRTPVFVDCAVLAVLRADARQKHLKDESDRGHLPAAVAAALRSAGDAAGIVAALGGVVDPRGSPDGAPVSVGTPILQPTDERRRTGSHYTPRTLTDPIVRQALAPALQHLGPDATPAQILDLKVCDPAMGSGAFLVEACRQLGERLVRAWASPGPKPAIPADEDEEVHARRLVAQRCLYGVDKNPMATDLARLSLWLATLAREHEFTFLDHAVKSGDSLVGLTRAQIAAAHWNTSRPGLTLLRQLVTARIEEALRKRSEIREAPDNVERSIQEQRHRLVEIGVERLRQVGDALIAAFFTSESSRERETRRAEIESWFAGGVDVWRRVAVAAAELQQNPRPVQPFHWEIEFPEVFERQNAGFDAVVGNPPFMGGTRISEQRGMAYFQWLTDSFHSCRHHCDLVAYFFRRMFLQLRDGGCLGLIATNTLGQGDTREGGLSILLSAGAQIYHAVRRLPWPGMAAVIVSVVHIAKGRPVGTPILDGMPVRRISSYLVSGNVDLSPAPLTANPYFSLGSKIYGQGFLFADSDGECTPIADRESLLATHPGWKNRIPPYLGGEEVNSDPFHRPKRFVISLNDVVDEAGLAEWPELKNIVERKVKPERLKLGNNPNNVPLKRRWWAFQAHRPELYAAIAQLKRVLVIARVGPHCSFVFLEASSIFSEQLVVFPLDTDAAFCALQSRTHEIWARFFSSSMKDDLRYTPSDCFKTFPFPADWVIQPDLEAAGRAYYDFRATLMVRNDEGLTKTYNRFHDPNERDPEIARLRLLHAMMDRVALDAYGWNDIPTACDFFLDYEIDEENWGNRKKPFRYRWCDEVRDEVLSRLLNLSAQRAAAEAAALEGIASKGMRKAAIGQTELI